MVKIDIVSGFLGAGKTTLIKKLLAEAFQGEQVVLIENEFGEIGVDGGFLKESGIQIREMNSGCICCSLVGDFGESLREVVATYHPDRILIEPSGVGKLSDVIKAVQGVQQDVEMHLNSYTTVVDAKKCKVYMRNFGEFFNNQVQFAGTIVMSRTDIISEEKAQEAMEMLRQINPKAAIISTPIAKLEGAKLLDVMEHPISLEQEMLDAEVEHHHDHDHDHEHHHDHDEEGHEHHHDHDEEGHEHHHDHDEEGHEHHHDHDEEGHEHHHDHDEEGHEHHHDHDEEGHEHHHDHDEEGHEHHHDHDEEGHEHHHDHDHDHHHGHHHDHHHADEIFDSWGHETVKKYERADIEKILQTLSESEEYGQILRAKGMLEAADGTWTYFDMVPGEVEVREGNPDFTGRICVIGAQLKQDKLAQLFGMA